jgi:hypothetical protein
MTGICKAWVTFGGGTGNTAGAIQGTAFNIGSITVVSTGIYQINFTTAMPDANYSVSATASTSNGIANISNIQIFTSSASATFTAPTTSSFYVFVGNSVYTAANNNLNCIQVFST